MLNKLKFLIKDLLNSNSSNIELLARLHLNNLLLIDPGKISKYNIEFNGFSQGGEDGVILFLCQLLKIKNGVEIGTENWIQSNLRLATRIFHLNVGLIDGELKNMKYVEDDKISYLEHVSTLASWVNKDNINDLLGNLQSKMNVEEFDLISLDIDGVDYYVFQNINYKPKVYIVEYNSIFGENDSCTVPYDNTFFRYNFHKSGTIYGCSYKLWINAMNKKGYKLVFTTSTGNNLFFIRNDVFETFNSYNISTLSQFENMSYRESLDKNGKRLKESSFEIKKYLNEVKIVNFE